MHQAGVRDMQLVRSIVLKTCVDGTIIREVTLSDRITRDHVRHLKKMGKVILLDDPETPFFSFETDQFSVKGVLDDNVIHFRYRKGSDQDPVTPFLAMIHPPGW